MSVTSGFFNSVNGDRKYNAEQFSDLFDGLINDGVFAGIGQAFAVSVNNGTTITVAPGKAWFNKVWILNDSLMSLSLDPAEMVQDRIDAVVITVDKSDAVRNSTITIITGTPSATNPSAPDMKNTNEVHQYPLAYIYRKANSSEVTQADITNAVGTEKCPFVTGIIQVLSIDSIVAQWQDEFGTWFNNLGDILDENAATKMAAHMSNNENPHHVTLQQLGIEYGDTLPSPGNKGRIYFLKV